MKIKIRHGTSKDGEDIVRLFSEGENPHNWTLQKWKHYYQEYPEGKTVSFVAESEQGIIGHYGLYPVKIWNSQVYMGAHAYVSESVRGLAVISQLMKSLDDFCVAHGIPFIVGFANPKFTIVKTKLFKWKTPFHASFIVSKQYDPVAYNERPFRFQYSEQWLKWRFGQDSDPVISQHRRAESEIVSYQLLYSHSRVTSKDFGLPHFECWSPEGYLKDPDEKHFSQPFSLKIYDKHWDGPDLLNPLNWHIQMGDSDTFVFKAIRS